MTSNIEGGRIFEPPGTPSEAVDPVADLVEGVLEKFGTGALDESQSDTFRHEFISMVRRAKNCLGEEGFRRATTWDLIQSMKENPDNDDEDPERILAKKLRKKKVEYLKSTRIAARSMTLLHELIRTPQACPPPIDLLRGLHSDEALANQKRAYNEGGNKGTFNRDAIGSKRHRPI